MEELSPNAGVNLVHLGLIFKAGRLPLTPLCPGSGAAKLNQSLSIVSWGGGTCLQNGQTRWSERSYGLLAIEMKKASAALTCGTENSSG
jgi:hypothetical protein